MGDVYLQEIILFLTAAGILVPLAHRFRVSPVLGFLLVGIVIGPYGLGLLIEALPWLQYLTISDSEHVHILAEFGVVFLLFMIGLDLSLERLWSLRRYVFGLGGTQVVITSCLIGSIALLFGNQPEQAIILGAAFALSSTAVVLQVLTEEHRLGSASGRTSFAILLMQDLAVVPILFIVGMLGASTGASVGIAFLKAIALAAVTIAAILMAGRLIIRPLFAFVGATRNRELFMAATLLIIILTSVISAKAGMSMALGAFLAGLLFAETKYRREIEVDIEPFKGLLLGVFFMSVGMAIDLRFVLQNPVWIFLSVLGLIVIKSAVLYGICRTFALPRPVALETSVSLSQGGEFAFVIIGLAMVSGILSTDVGQFMLIVTALSIALAPPTINLAQKMAHKLGEKELETLEDVSVIPPDLNGHVLIAGYGRVGQMIAKLLDDQKVPYIALDSSSSLVAQHGYKGGTLVYGNATHPEMLRRMGIGAAQALVVTMGDPSIANKVVTAAKAAAQNIRIYSRAADLPHAHALIKDGATSVVPETIEASLLLGEVLLKGIGIPDQAAHKIVEDKRQETRAALMVALMTNKTPKPDKDSPI